MASIQFYCPNCKSLIAFESKYSGKNAHCTNCSQHFIIPKKDFEEPEIIKAPREKEYPIPGFYKALFVDSWKIFINWENIIPLVFVAAVVCFQFFLAKGICCVNYLTYIVTWSFLLGFYLNVIYEAAFDSDVLPQIDFGESHIFIWNLLKPFLIFIFTAFLTELPFFITLSLLQNKNITPENMWQSHSGYRLLLQILFIGGLFIFPMAILTIAVGKDFSLLRPDHLFLPIIKAFIPYIIICTLLFLVCFLVNYMKSFDTDANIPLWKHLAQLGYNLAVQIPVIIAMRAIGLFHRHYSCYLGW